MRESLLIAFSAVMLWGGCASRKQPLLEPVKETPPVQTVQPAPPAQPEPAEQMDDNNQQYVGSRGVVNDVWGWRVQIFASGTLENARKVAEEARWRFGDQQVYLAEVYPYYKVQVGNNLTRQDAERLRKRAQKLGYEGVFIVEVNLAE